MTENTHSPSSRANKRTAASATRLGRVVPDASRWRFGRLSSAPHRIAFASAATMLGATGLWWHLR